jgi:predicted nucleic acid-binding protein
LIVTDASIVVAALLGVDADGAFAGDVLAGEQTIAAPHLTPAEVTHAIRRLAQAGDLGDAEASIAVREATQLRMSLYPFAPFADRVWELRTNVTAYDAWYVALAEALEVPLATLDRRLATAPGPRCRFLTP